MNFLHLFKFSTFVLLVPLLWACSPAGKPVFNLSPSGNYAAALSQDGSLAIVSSSDGITLWDIPNQRAKYQWWQGDRRDNVIAVALSNNNQYAATLSSDSVALWQLSDGKSLGWWSLSGQAQCVAVANDGQLLVGSADASVFYLAAERQRLVKFLGHTEKVNSVAFAADGKLALTGGNDAKALLWRTADGKIIKQWATDSRVLTTAISPSGKLAFVSDSTGNAFIWDIAQQRQVSRLNIHTRLMNFTAVSFIQQEQQLLTGTPNRESQLWRISTGEKLGSWQVAIPPKPQPPGAVVYAVSQWGGNGIQAISSSGMLERWQHP
ncbi:hypothetical protein JYB87_15215 [Shewanella avicenniae]|uniref:Bulb-type lectin domain-containing protein n=1 Tax=Shewanella avicenniae TaxID=2814294 RepID=A0ABX7QP73_9GAMM|nr:hypothetical protein [Shewanella avicenniae]QSX33064.1 hypothetical protein JYB87_15215 [Shewanella avicenniae]